MSGCQNEIFCHSQQFFSLLIKVFMFNYYSYSENGDRLFSFRLTGWNSTISSRKIITLYKICERKIYFVHLIYLNFTTPYLSFKDNCCHQSIVFPWTSTKNQKVNVSFKKYIWRLPSKCKNLSINITYNEFLVSILIKIYTLKIIYVQMLELSSINFSMKFIV